MAAKKDLVLVVTRQIRDLRLRLGVTQERLAELLEVPVQHISRIEAGQNITLATLERIATALGHDVRLDFVAASGGPRRPAPSVRQKTRAKKTAPRT